MFCEVASLIFSTDTSALRLRSIFTLMLQAAEIGTHFIRQAGQAIQQLGVVTEHFVLLGILVYDVVVNLAPALLEQRSALEFNIVGGLLLKGRRHVEAEGGHVNVVTRGFQGGGKNLLFHSWVSSLSQSRKY